MKKTQLVAACAAMIGAPIVALDIGTLTASADPGVAVSVNGSDSVGIGDATATSSKGTAALAFNGIAGQQHTATVGQEGIDLDGSLAGEKSHLTINQESFNLTASLCGGSQVSAQSDSIDVSAPCAGVK